MKIKDIINWYNKHAEECQLAADDMANTIIEQKKILATIPVFQSMCNFNLFWLYQISPEMLLHIETVSFLADNVHKFKRKISINEILKYDFIITKMNVKDFDNFKKALNINH